LVKAKQNSSFLDFRWVRIGCGVCDQFASRHFHKKGM